MNRFHIEGNVQEICRTGGDGIILWLAMGESFQALDSELRPGQFFMLRTEREGFPFVNRPFSVFDQRPGEFGVELAFLFKVVGPGTKALASADVGSKVLAIGPLGNGFPDPPGEGRVLFVAGGVGLPPLYLKAKEWVSQAGQDAQNRGLILYGSSSFQTLYGLEVLEALGLPIQYSTDDGTKGHHGRVDRLLINSIEAKEPISQILACGPEPMLEAVAKIAKKGNIPAFLALENFMACGFGVCNSCAVKVEDLNYREGYRYARACQEGPVFESSKLIFEKAV